MSDGSGISIVTPLNRSRYVISLLCLRSTEEEVLTTRLIEKAIRKSEAVDRESLCILAGEKVRILLFYILTPYNPSRRCALKRRADPFQRLYRYGQSE